MIIILLGYLKDIKYKATFDSRSEGGNSVSQVRIKDNVQCHQQYHDGGTLIFQDRKYVDKGEYRVGIQVEFGVCFDFHPDDYELIKLKEK